MGKPVKVKTSFGEKYVKFASIFSGILLLAVLLPVVPWRYAPINALMGNRFPSFRTYSLLGISTQTGSMGTWMSMRTKLCRAHVSLMAVDPVASALAIGSMALGTGGAIAGCAAWGDCKAHAGQRCTSYGMIAILGILCALMIAGSMVLSFYTMMAQHMEAAVEKRKASEKKKKKKKEGGHVPSAVMDARWRTMMAATGAFMNNFFGMMMFNFGTGKMIKDLGLRAAYPFPSAHIGPYVSMIAWMMQFWVMIICINRWCPIRELCGFSKEEDDKNEENMPRGGAYEGYASQAPPMYDPLMAGAYPPPPPGMGNF